MEMLKTIEKNLSKIQKGELETFGRTINKLGANFAVSDADGRLLLTCQGNIFETDWQSIVNDCLKDLDTSNPKADEQAFQINDRIAAVFLRLDSNSPAHIALVDVGEELQPAKERKQDADKGHITARQSSQLCEIVSDMLTLLAKRFLSEAKSEQQAVTFGTELSQVYEELALIHKLSTNMRISNSDSNYLQMACDCLREIVGVEGMVILLEKKADDEKRLVLTAGAGLIDIDKPIKEILFDRLVAEIEMGKEVLLDSSVDGPFKYKWPDYIKNIIAVPLYGKDRLSTGFSETGGDSNCIVGLMAAINRIGKPDFDSVDIKLFNSVANGCAVFVENGRLFGDLKELFIGSLKALTSSIDAKDQYTRGHSERVAFISQWIAERYAESEKIDESVMHNIYLTGLLHDIGKIGISEAVLCKKGKLTTEELNCIRRHPLIGANILKGIKQMHDIIPGVLCHHERMDGKGYPNGLTADKIPLSGKIVGLADSFDAMTSARVYRKALSLEEAIEEIRKGMGTQFDEKVATVFLNNDVYHLWDIIQDGLAGTFSEKEFPYYNTEAVGTLVK
jgi:HD-GYP domain-containing protein (c-di-GMP phosphodiesterase class II)